MSFVFNTWSIVVIILLSFIVEGQFQTTSNKEFVFAFPINFAGAISMQLSIHTHQEPSATFNITTADGGYSFSGTCSPLNPAIVDIPTIYEVRSNEFDYRQKSFRVFSNQNISVVAWSAQSQFTYSTTLVYPACEKAAIFVPLYTYYAMSTEPAGFGQAQSQLLIVGCQDTTSVTITPTQNITIPADLQSLSDTTTMTVAAGEAYSLVLNSMQTLLISSLFDLSGTKIESVRNPLSVISGSQCANIPSDVCCCDFIMTHVPPTHQWGRRFLLSPHKGRFAQGYKILAQSDETLVVTTCNESAITNYMLNDKQSVVFFTRGDTYCSVESTDLIYMVQLGVGGSYENDNVGDPSLNNVPPIEQHLNIVQFTAHFGDSHYSIVVQNDNFFTGRIILDGLLQTISNWRSIYDFNDNIVGYGFTSEVFTGTHTIAHPNSNGVLSVSVYGWSRFGGYGYAAGSSLLVTSQSNTNVVISPTHGSMLGGTVITISNSNLGLVSPLRPPSKIVCMFDSTAVIGAVVFSNEAICISPRLDRSGPVQLSVLIDGRQINQTRNKIFYSQHYSDIADVNVMNTNLLVSSEHEIVLNWNNSSFIPNMGEGWKLDIILHEARVSRNRKVEWTNEIHLARDINNTGVVEIEIPGPKMLPFLNEASGYSDTAHYIILFQLIVNTSLSNTNNALKQLSNEGLHAGMWSHVFFRKVQTEQDNIICSKWNDTDSNHPTLVAVKGVDGCPCTQAQADLPMSTFAPRTAPGQKKLDTFFHEDSVCYGPKRTIVDTVNGIFKLSQQCCYNANGSLIVGGSRAGSVDTQPPHEWENHFIFDLDPFITCCKGSGSSNNDIRKYYERRPTDTCLTFRPLDPPARARGDPHLLTLDGYEYTFNGKGEFTMINSSLFQLQGRMTSLQGPGGRASPGTVFSALAAKQTDSDTVEVQVGEERPVLLVNGVRVELNDDREEMHNNVTVRVRTGAYAITFSTGAYLEINQTNGFLSSVVVSLPRSYYGLTNGLLGVYNGDPEDDLLPYNGFEPIPLNSTMEEIHFRFGITWIIGDQNHSLFTYESESSFDTFNQPDFTPAFRTEFTDPALEEEANEICKGDQMCLFDIAATGRTEIGMDTLQQQEQIDEIMRIITTPVICDPPCLNGICVANDTCSCHYGYTGNLCDVEDLCVYDISPVPCGNPVDGWIFNSDSGTCEFGGCRERGNVFKTMAECVRNCGGCTSEGGSCPLDLNACELSSCRAFPQARCEVDACDPCGIAHFISGVREVTDRCDEVSCDNPTNCLIQPCDVTHCPNHPNAVCLPDYCDGCKARFYTEVGVDITDQCTNCPPERPEVQCPYNPCEYEVCSNFPDAECMFDSCGQCKARFFDGDTEVTQQCERCVIQGQTFQSCVSQCPRTCNNYRDSFTCTEQCVPGCTCPDNMLLDEDNNRCVLVEECPCPACDSVSDNCSVTVVSNSSCLCPVCADCPDGQEFEECKSCPQTCLETFNSNLVCPDECVAGCQCQDGKLYDETSKQCVDRTECPEPDLCTLPRVEGPCLGNIKRYYYNDQTQKCEAFRYGGCIGNKNNFFSLHECELACSDVPPTCSPSFCITRRNDMCRVRDDEMSCPNCPDYVVSNCQACYYRLTPLPFDNDLCVRDCVTDDGVYDSGCLRDWGNCLKRQFRSDFSSTPLEQRVIENYKCFEYTDVPPTCSPSFCTTRRNDMCRVRDDDMSSPSCPDYVVSNCQACYYSPTPLPFDNNLCVRDCVTDDGVYDSGCLRDWGNCLKRQFRSEFSLTPLEQRVTENYRCFEYVCRE